ncbi:MAG: hypothetical protein SNJ57_20860 [Cyanobacteriota bacterium]
MAFLSQFLGLFLSKSPDWAIAQSGDSTGFGRGRSQNWLFDVPKTYSMRLNAPNQGI